MPDSPKQITLSIFTLLVLLLGGTVIYLLGRLCWDSIEGFYGDSNSDSNKRFRKMKIYKSDEILDPDESLYDFNDDEGDPDINPNLYDPDG